MPQPPVDLKKYFSNTLPNVREQYPPGTGGTGPRADWKDGNLKAVQVIDSFDSQVKQYIDQSLPKEPLHTHWAYKYPSINHETKNIPSVIKAPSDLQKALEVLPLPAISSILTGLDADPEDIHEGARGLDKAGYESDGEVDVKATEKPRRGTTKPWQWKFNKSPLGSGEFYLQRQGSDEVKLVVRTINSSAFSPADWEEYVVSGSYHYNTKSKASWYWSRASAATKRLNCQYWVLTDWNRWVFGKFDSSREHGWVSPIFNNDSSEPTVLEALFYWARSALGDANGFKEEKKDVGSGSKLFPDNPARRQAGKVADPNKPKAANESDIEESDAE